MDCICCFPYYYPDLDEQQEQQDKQQEEQKKQQSLFIDTEIESETNDESPPGTTSESPPGTTIESPTGTTIESPTGTNNHHIDACFFHGILLYSRIINEINLFTRYMYSNHRFVKQTVDTISYRFREFYACMTNRRIEPQQNNWINFAGMVQDYNAFEYYTNYVFLSQDDNHSYDNQISKISYPMNILHPWIQIKRHLSKDDDPYYITRVLYNYEDHVNLNDSFDKDNKKEASSVKFLSIEYSNPKMDHRIPLELDKAYLIAKNDLFMPAYILHLLEHQDEPFYFDMAYRIHIIDNQVNMVELKSNEYIRIQKNFYEICQLRLRSFFRPLH